MKLNFLIRLPMALALILAATTAISGSNNPQPRPFWGSFEGEAGWVANGVCDGPGGTGSPVQTVTEAEGAMTHMGHTFQLSTHCATWPDGMMALGGEVILTAANGNEVWAEYTAVAVLPPPIIVMEATYAIDGGTGRFEGASGSFDGTIYITFEGLDDPSWPLEMVFSGWIVY